MNAMPEPSLKISAEERASRIASVNFARGSVRYEGFILKAEVEALNQRYIDGELTGDEFTRAALASAGVVNP